MEYEEVVQAIERLSGEIIDVLIRGVGGDSALVAQLTGELSRMGDVEFSGQVKDILDTAVVERAVTFIVGDSTFALLPSRFVEASPLEHRSDWLDVRTRDATLWIGPKRPAWYD